MKTLLIYIGIVFIPYICYGQQLYKAEELKAKTPYDNIYVEKLAGDKNSSTFLIIIDKFVKLHKHETHSETIYIVEGEGEMNIGDSLKSVMAGDVLFLKEGTPHSLKVTSKIPVKVISVQSPEFDGTDRIFLE